HLSHARRVRLRPSLLLGFRMLWPSGRSSSDFPRPRGSHFHFANKDLAPPPSRLVPDDRLVPFDNRLLPPIATLGSSASSRRTLLQLRHTTLRGSLLARPRRPMERPLPSHS